MFSFLSSLLITALAVVVFMVGTIQEMPLPIHIQEEKKEEKNLIQKEQQKVDVFYRVVHVVDGDTFDVLIDGKKERVRALGINTPETVDPRKTVECFGKEASQKAKELLFNKDVRLEKDPSQGERDKYGRLLRYVTRDDDLFFNQWMIENGYAYEYTYDVPYRFQMVFKEAQRTARKAAVGLWAPGVCGNNF